MGEALEMLALSGDDLPLSLSCLHQDLDTNSTPAALLARKYAKGLEELRSFTYGAYKPFVISQLKAGATARHLSDLLRSAFKVPDGCKTRLVLFTKQHPVLHCYAFADCLLMRYRASF